MHDHFSHIDTSVNNKWTVFSENYESIYENKQEQVLYGDYKVFVNKQYNNNGTCAIVVELQM